MDKFCMGHASASDWRGAKMLLDGALLWPLWVYHRISTPDERGHRPGRRLPEEAVEDQPNLGRLFRVKRT